MDSKTQEDFREDQIAKQIVDSAIKVHKAMGPGLLESLYEACLCEELTSRNIAVRRQVPIPVVYNDKDMGVGFRLDLLVEDRVILEMKCTDKITPIHEAQILTYMKLANIRLGMIINFNEILVKNGIKRFVLRSQTLGVLGVLGGEKIVGHSS